MPVLDGQRNLRLPIADVVGILIDVLGTKMVAVIGGATATRTVRGWASGEYEPKAKDLLRSTLQIVDVLLAGREQKDVVRAWFGGLNHNLGDENPALTLARGDGASIRSVLDAARAFISM